MTSSELLASIRKRLAALACPNHRDGMTNYFKGSIVAYGVRTPEVRRLASGNWKIFKEWSPDERERFCETLWKDGWFEEGALAIYLYRRLAPRCGAREFRLFQSWIERHVGNWAHCDGVASWLISASIAKEPELMDKLPPWTMSRNRWKRRAAAVSLLQEAKMGRSTSHVLGIADAMLDDADDMVQKGVGWLLKEAYPKKPTEIVEFLAARKARPSRLMLRYAAEKMTSKHKRTVLS